MLQQVEEARKGFGYEVMQGSALPGRDQAGAPAPKEALQTLSDAQGRRGQTLQQTAVEGLERRGWEKQRLESGVVFWFWGEEVSTCCLSSRRRSWSVRSLCSSLFPTRELNW